MTDLSNETITHRHIATACPTCKAPLDASDEYAGDHGKPEPGDHSVCAYCASLLRFDQNLALRLLTLEEVAALDDDTRIELQRARRLVEHRLSALQRSEP